MPLAIALIFIVVRLFIEWCREDNAKAYAREYLKNNPRNNGFDVEQYRKTYNKQWNYNPSKRKRKNGRQ